MSKRILVIQGHPDASMPHLCHALANSYNLGAESAGHSVKHVNVAELDFRCCVAKKILKQAQFPPASNPYKTTCCGLSI